MRPSTRGFPLIVAGDARDPVPRRAGPGAARSTRASRRCCGPASCGSSSSTTSPGASTRSATSSAQRRFETGDHSTNVFWLALPSLGEAWHHNHHAFPRSAFHGLRWYELDPSGWLILAMAKLGSLGRRALDREPSARSSRRRSPGTVCGGVVGTRNRASPEAGQAKPRLRGVSHQWGFFVSLACGRALIAPHTAVARQPRRRSTPSATLGAARHEHALSPRQLAPAARRCMRRLDRAMIYVLIAASYTPFALLALHGVLATAMLMTVWAGASRALLSSWPGPITRSGSSSSRHGARLGRGHNAHAAAREIGWVAVGRADRGRRCSRPAPSSTRASVRTRPGVFGYHEVFHALVLPPRRSSTR